MTIRREKLGGMLSPQGRESAMAVLGKSLNGEHSRALENLLPLPGGEGWGEGERQFQLNRFSDEQVGVELPSAYAGAGSGELIPRVLSQTACYRKRFLNKLKSN